MLFLWLGLAVVILGISFYFWPKDQRTLRTVITTGAILSALIAAGILIARSIPIKRTEIVEKVTKYKEPPKIVYKDKIVLRIPGKEYAPVDVKAICKGSSPVTIVQMNVTDPDKDNRTTWITGKVPGSEVKFTCGQPGDYSDSWAVGDTVQFTRGEAQ